MSFPFPQYAKVKNNYCCCYNGNTIEYIVQLKILRPQIEEQLPGINVFLSCKEKYFYILENEKNAFPIEKLEENKKNLCYIREISFSSNKHPILELMEESDLKIKPIEFEPKKNKIALLCPEGIYPTRSMSQDEINKAKSWLEKNKYSYQVLGSDVHSSIKDIKTRPYGKEKYLYLNDASLVVGVENEYIFSGIELGLDTMLVNNGLGKDLYKRMSKYGKMFI